MRCRIDANIQVMLLQGPDHTHIDDSESNGFNREESDTLLGLHIMPMMSSRKGYILLQLPILISD